MILLNLKAASININYINARSGEFETGFSLGQDGSLQLTLRIEELNFRGLWQVLHPNAVAFLFYLYVSHCLHIVNGSNRLNLELAPNGGFAIGFYAVFGHVERYVLAVNAHKGRCISSNRSFSIKRNRLQSCAVSKGCSRYAANIGRQYD